jgi:hypothetical protein
VFEVFVRIESMAPGTYTVDQTPTQQEQEAHNPTTPADLIPVIDPTMEQTSHESGTSCHTPDDSGNPNLTATGLSQNRMEPVKAEPPSNSAAMSRFGRMPQLELPACSSRRRSFISEISCRLT